MGIKMTKAAKSNQIKKWFSFIILLLGILMLCTSTSTAERKKSTRMIRVGLIEAKGLSETAADGSWHGLVIDYLNEIAKYTGWKYEYVETTSQNIFKEFEQGKFELIGSSYYTTSLEKYFSYPDYNIGYSKAVLFTQKDNTSIHSYDLRTLNGKTIGVYKGDVENIRRLKQFLSYNKLDCSLKYYSHEQLSDAGNLNHYLKNGEIDLLLGNISEQNDTIRIAVTYNAQPYYLVTNVGNNEILDGLNMALEKIMDSNPNFAAERYSYNFPDSPAINIFLNNDELKYVQKKQVISVAMPQSFHPFSCLNTDDTHDGLVYDILNEITSFSGLNFSYIYTETYKEAIDLVQQGKADMLGFFLGTEEDTKQLDLALTTPYVSMSCIVVRNKTSNYPDTDLVAAVIKGRNLPSKINASKVRIYNNTTEALDAVNQGVCDFTYGLTSRLERDIQRNHFANLVPVTLGNNRSDISFAIPKPINPNLLTILNKGINNVSSEKKSDLINKNLVSIGANEFSLEEFIYANPILFIITVTFFLFIFVAIILWINHTKTRAAVMQNHLDKAKAESQAKGEFLSRMSHEIRTPMNAVVGLSDLVSMTEGVPQNVQENLSKLRSSSHYLLNLINDILDMSRLDSGMLTIANEPFSLEHMLNEIQSMMEVSAKQRELEFKIEKDFIHSDLTGDIIRLRQVLTNLLSNAFKFTGKGGTVILRVAEQGCTDLGVDFSFQVIDTGVGISSTDQDRIFGTFEQVGTSFSKSQGTGLGLAISRSIVQIMGGELCVKSELDYGSEFYFTITIPLGEPVTELYDEIDDLKSDKLLENIHILLAEDNDLNAEIAIQLLEIQGASVCWKQNGKRAIEQFVKSKPFEFQVILMDIQMPEMDGLEATRAIRHLNRPDSTTIPIIAMTANAFKEDADAALSVGMNGFLSKPLDVNQLYHTLHSIKKSLNSD